jgi:hypothetical protein
LEVVSKPEAVNSPCCLTGESRYPVDKLVWAPAFAGETAQEPIRLFWIPAAM